MTYLIPILFLITSCNFIKLVDGEKTKIDDSFYNSPEQPSENEPGIVCPAGYLSVNGNSTYSTSNFCVMKYEAKAWLDSNSNGIYDSGEEDSDGCLEAACTTSNWGSATHLPTSIANGMPWRKIDVTTAKAQCLNLGTGYDLISNPEWMTIAREIENISSNWVTNTTTGQPCLKAGNYGGDASAPASCGYNNSASMDSGTGRNTLAMHTLENGGEIWDLAGNAGEMVDWTIGGQLDASPYINCSGNTYQEHNSLTSCNDSSNNNISLDGINFQPSTTSLTKTAGVGLFYKSTNGNGHVGRSGGFNAFGNASVYFITLGRGLTSNSNTWGFRCVYRP